MQKYNVAIIIAAAVGQGFCLHKGVLVPDVAYLTRSNLELTARAPRESAQAEPPSACNHKTQPLCVLLDSKFTLTPMRFIELKLVTVMR
jgi:hypothetical protein